MSDEPAFLTAPPISVESLSGSPGDAGPSAADADDPSRGADVDAYLATLDAAAATNGAAAAAPTDPTVTLADFVARKADNADMLVSCEQGTLLPPAGFGLLVSKSGAGKTTIMADFILHAAAGRDWCGLQFPRPLRVLVIENEGPREAFRQKLERRLASWAAVEGEQQIRVWDDPARWGQVRLSSSEQLAQLRAAADAHQIDLCVSDTLTRFGMRGNGTPEETREFVELMTAAGLTRDLAFLLLHHPVTRPDQVSDELERIAGAWPPHADAIVYLQKLTSNRARLSFPKLRWATGQRPASILAFTPENETFQLVAEETHDDDKPSPETYEQRILDHLADHPNATTDELENDVEGNAAELRAARKRLLDAGRVTRTPSRDLGLPGKAMRWNTAPENESSPVPLSKTGQDADTSPPVTNAPNPVSPSPHKRDGVGGRGSGTGFRGSRLDADRRGSRVGLNAHPTASTTPGSAVPKLPRAMSRPVPALALTPAEAAAAIGVSAEFFREHVDAELRWIRRGRKRLVSVRELEEWLDRNGERVL